MVSCLLQRSTQRRGLYLPVSFGKNKINWSLVCPHLNQDGSDEDTNVSVQVFSVQGVLVAFYRRSQGDKRRTRKVTHAKLRCSSAMVDGRSAMFPDLKADPKPNLSPCPPEIWARMCTCAVCCAQAEEPPLTDFPPPRHMSPNPVPITPTPIPQLSIPTNSPPTHLEPYGEAGCISLEVFVL